MRIVLACAAVAAATTMVSSAQRRDPYEVRIEIYANQGGAAVTDLRADEVELLENGDPQQLDRFDYVRPKVRMVAAFFDTYHLSDPAGERRRAVARVLDKAAGDQDVASLVYPGMPAGGVRFRPKLEVVDDLLEEGGVWEGRLDANRTIRVEEHWASCYGKGERLNEMIARRREQASLDALEDLVEGAARLPHERKAVLVASDGWKLFGTSRRLSGLGSRDQRPAQPPSAPGYDCDAARGELALIDNSSRIDEIVALANRANISFYAFASPSNQLRDLAAKTDGTVVTSDLDAAARRISDDLTAYYWATYKSSNRRADGKNRTIAVRVKRAGVLARARATYPGPTREEVVMAARFATPPPSPAAPTTTTTATSPAVSGILHRPDEMVNPVNLASLRHVVLYKRGPATGREYVASEDPRLRRTDRLRLEHAASTPGTTTARMLNGAGQPMIVPVAVSERPDPSGQYRWIVAEAVLAPLAPGEYSIEVTVGDLAVNTPFQIVP